MKNLNQKGQSTLEFLAGLSLSFASGGLVLILIYNQLLHIFIQKELYEVNICIASRQYESKCQELAKTKLKSAYGPVRQIQFVSQKNSREVRTEIQWTIFSLPYQFRKIHRLYLPLKPS